jgi:hypothetical protein
VFCFGGCTVLETVAHNQRGDETGIVEIGGGSVLRFAPMA